MKVLRVLFTSDLDLTGRRIADLSGLNAPTASNVLRRLEEIHLVEVRQVGRAKLYRMKGSHPMVQKILAPLFKEEREMLDVQMRNIAARFASFNVTTILFGSVARGEETAGSDLDICLVIPLLGPKGEVQHLAEEETLRLAETTGVVPTFLVMTQEEFASRYRKGEALLRAIVKEGKVFGGESIERLVRSGGN